MPLASLLVACVIAAPLQVAVGKAPPALEIVDGVPAGKIPLDAIAGLVQVRVLARLADRESLLFLETIDALDAEFLSEPVVMYAVTNEPRAEIEKIRVDENVPTPILIGSGDGGMRDHAVGDFPIAMVIDGSGNVRFHGTPGSGNEIREALLEVLGTADPRVTLPASAKAIARNAERGLFGDAMKGLEKELQKPSLRDADRAAFENVKARIALQHARLVASLATLEETEDWPLLITVLTRLEKECAGLEGSEAAAARLAALREKAEDDAELSRELAAAVDFAKAERLERDRDYKKAHAAYAAVARSAGATKAGTQAASRAALFKGRAGVK
jgi:hypothetical protein